MSNKVLKKLKSNPDPKVAPKLGDISFENQKKYARAVKELETKKKADPSFEYTTKDVVEVYERLGGLWFKNGEVQNPRGIPPEEAEE